MLRTISMRLSGVLTKSAGSLSINSLGSTRLVAPVIARRFAVSETGTDKKKTEKLVVEEVQVPKTSACPVIAQQATLETSNSAPVSTEKVVVASVATAETAVVVVPQKIPSIFKTLGFITAGSMLSMSVASLGIIGYPELGIEAFLSPNHQLVSLTQIKSASNLILFQIAGAAALTTVSGSVHMGLEISSPSESWKGRWLRMGMTVVPVVANALFVTVLVRDQALLGVLGLANVQLMADTFAFKRGLIPEWYLRLRLPVVLTCMASLGLSYMILTQDLSTFLVARP